MGILARFLQRMPVAGTVRVNRDRTEIRGGPPVPGLRPSGVELCLLWDRTEIRGGPPVLGPPPMQVGASLNQYQLK